MSWRNSIQSGRWPRLVAFDRRRWIVFASVLALIFCLGLFGVRAGLIVPYFGGAFFILGLSILYVPGVLFAWTGFFRFSEFGAAPVGVGGYVVMALFYAAVAVLASWPLAPRRAQKAQKGL